ncbi:hypothetical protein, partial [Nocardia cyriacigeorgica]|uniref:hypothetical protein n=1 Tax=Nocardia cyriacigeorgica TaxID=135487 RepID=UPI001E29FA77
VHACIHKSCTNLIDSAFTLDTMHNERNQNPFLVYRHNHLTSKVLRVLCKNVCGAVRLKPTSGQHIGRSVLHGTPPPLHGVI